MRSQATQGRPICWRNNIGGVSAAAGQTGEAASQVLSVASELAQQAERLRGEVAAFLSTLRAA
jgi:methyl-accepting chemotaxis protein